MRSSYVMVLWALSQGVGAAGPLPQLAAPGPASDLEADLEADR
ncbi:hypothetical protein [Paenarthrobacter histidinolovorans]|uniref:Uncharacterized protein n=1 Tax=Paenarthrobacter histidinolovorans TaxID=43664 RepID=A0ABW8N1U0_9MICC